MVETKIKNVFDIPNIENSLEERAFFECYDIGDNTQCYCLDDIDSDGMDIEVDIVIISDEKMIDSNPTVLSLLTQHNLKYLSWTHSLLNDNPIEKYVYNSNDITN